MKGNIEPVYGYTIKDDVDNTLSDQSGDKFDEKALSRNRAMLVTASKPDRKAMRYMGTDKSNPDFNATKAGAGRGGMGGPTAKEMQEYKTKKNRGIYTAEMGPPPQDIDGGSAKPAKKYAKGGSVRGDGCAQRGHTKGKMR